MKYLKKKEKPKLPVILICVGFAAVLGFLGWLILREPDAPPATPDASVQDQTDSGRQDTTQPADQTDPGTQDTTQPADQPDATDDPTEATIPVLELPYSMEGGKLTVDSILQFTGLNPDRQNEEAEDVAAIQLTNTSSEHLASLTVTVVTTEGATATFKAYDIPPGMGAMVMSPDNSPIESNPDCAQITCEAEFLPQSPLAADQLLISVMGTEITVENISGKDLSQITLYCHNMLDQSSYGGATIVYEIDSLPAGESTVVSAWDCYLGLVEVVRVEIGSE